MASELKGYQHHTVCRCLCSRTLSASASSRLRSAINLFTDSSRVSTLDLACIHMMHNNVTCCIYAPFFYKGSGEDIHRHTSAVRGSSKMASVCESAQAVDAVSDVQCASSSSACKLPSIDCSLATHVSAAAARCCAAAAARLSQSTLRLSS